MSGLGARWWIGTAAALLAHTLSLLVFVAALALACGVVLGLLWSAGTLLGLG